MSMDQPGFTVKFALTLSNLSKPSNTTRKFIQRMIFMTVKCVGKAFKSVVSLRNHEKYVHTDAIKHSCKSCDSKFTQKKNLRSHYLHVHGVNQFRKEYHQLKKMEKYLCEEFGLD